MPSTIRTSILEPLYACSSSPCENGGTCLDVNIDIFVCMCRDGFFRVTCSESKMLHVYNWHFICVTIITVLNKVKYHQRFPATGYSGTTFLATFDTYLLSPTDPVVFNNPVHNNGGHYDPTTGI